MATTSPARILLIGGSGKLGRRVAERLDGRDNISLRLLTRAPEALKGVFTSAVEIVAGDAADREALRRALVGIDRLFLLTPIAPELADLQIGVIKEAEQAGVQRIVKISGSDWTISHKDRSRAGAAHAVVEERLASGSIPYASLRPNAWMQVSLGGLLAAWRSGAAPPPPDRDPPVAYIHIDDIADVAILALTADELPLGPLVLTGPEALTAAEIYRLLPSLRPVQDGEASGAPRFAPYHAEAVAEFRVLIGEGLAAPVTSVVHDLLGRPAHTVVDHLRAIGLLTETR